MQDRLIQSPLNYTGGKYKLLSQILPFFPKKIELALDLFCGGANVGLNLNSKKLILNDKEKELIRLFEYFKKHQNDKIFKDLENLIDEFNLSKSSKMGYEFYNCNSTKGLASYNKENFLKLRNSYNKDKNILKLFLLIVFSFNNQLRFNSKNEFNLPCGKRDFNLNMQEKLRLFIEALQNKEVYFTNEDFRNFDIHILDKKSFVYIDPPYFLGRASYNENKAWDKDDELDLLDLLKKLDDRDIKFALSNVIFHKNKEQEILTQWLKNNPQFRIEFLNFSYKNCNYQAKNSYTQEILLRNYK